MLTIALETVCFIIVKAREFDVQVEPSDPDSGSNPSDDGEVDVLEGSRGNPTYEELVGAMGILNADERIDLVALAWVGRGDFDDFDEAREQAADSTVKNWPEYLIGIPLLGDFLDEGLANLGLSCEDVEIDRL
jgi:hypothetical protein